MADELRLKVSQNDYAQKLGALDQKINELAALYSEYAQVKMEAHQVLGEGDSNYQKLLDTVQANMDLVGQQHKLLVESRALLQKQNDQLGITTANIGTLITETLNTAKTAANVFKTVSDLM